MPILVETPIRVEVDIIKNRVKVLTKYLNSDPQRELQALYALQALMAILEQPASKSSICFPTICRPPAGFV